MAISTQDRGPSGGALTEVVQLILDRGVVIDAFVRVSLVGIETLTVDARVVMASVDTYLRYADAVGRVNLDTRKPAVPEVLEGRQAKAAIEAAPDQNGDVVGEVLGQPERAPREEER
jgi:anionic cell wall polymer biosynthesis LytR-Cps2A-Psr (LCP) family protein